MYRASAPPSAARRGTPPAAPASARHVAAAISPRRLRVFQRALRSRVERRDALVDIVRARQHDARPGAIAELIVARAATWLPVPSGLSCPRLSGQLVVLAERGLTPEMAPAVAPSRGG